MKRIILTAILLSLGTSHPAKADPNYTVVGAILGATAGMVIGNNVNGISMEVAVPVCAITGGVIGHHYEQHRYDYDWPNRYDNDRHFNHHNQYYPYNRHGRQDHYYPYERRGYDDYRYNRTSRYYPPKTVAPQRYTPKKINPQQFTAPDPHPGIELIKVTVLNVNGIRTDVPIRKVNNQYIGPQGEIYKSLPPAETLRRKYGL
jgi:hypothetical protein